MTEDRPARFRRADAALAFRRSEILLPCFSTLVREGPFAKVPDRHGPQANRSFLPRLPNGSRRRRRSERAAPFLTRPAHALIIILEVSFDGRVAPGQVLPTAEQHEGLIYAL